MKRAMRMAVTVAAVLCVLPSPLQAQLWHPLDTIPAKQISPLANLVAFQQVTWNLDAGRVADSDWGQVQINTRSLLLKALGSKGYVNVFLPDPNRFGGVQWAVNNLYVTTHPGCDDAASPMTSALLASAGNTLPATAYVDLRPGTEGSGRIQRLRAIVLFSSQPLPNLTRIQELAADVTPQWFTVQQVVVNAEGALGEPEGSAVSLAVTDIQALVGPPPQAIIAEPQLPQNFGFPILVTQAASPDIETAENQCVPMAFANAYQYLEDRYNDVPLVWSLPHLPIPGIGRTTVSGDVIGWEPDPDNSLIAQIDYRTQREGVFGFLTGAGSNLCQMVQGAFGYLATYPESAVVAYRHEGGSSMFYGDTDTEPAAVCDSDLFSLGGYVSTRQGAHPTWQWIFDQLQAGRAVAMVFGYYDVNGNRTGGHMQRVWGAGHFNGRDYLYTLDDGNQGLPFNGGLRTQSWEVADTGQPGLAGIPDGQLNMGGTNWEIEFAISIEAKPTLNIP